MAYNVSSWFVGQCLESAPLIVRQFYIGASDYSDYVVTWPTISTRWDEIKPNAITLNLSNADQTFNFLQQAKINVQLNCTLNMGFRNADSSTVELIQMFSGKISDITLKDATASLKTVDKVQYFSDRVVGQSNSPVVFSSQLPSDMFWTLCTCYGGLSSVQSTSNPDIDWTAFQLFAAIFSADLIYMAGQFNGQKVTEAIRKLMNNTQSAHFVAENKITVARWSSANTRIVSLDSDHIKGLSVSVAADKMVNRQWVEFMYDTTSKNWQFSLNAADSASVESYGIRETVMKDESIWYVDSVSAMNIAERMLFTNAQPYESVSVKTILGPLHQQVGETIIAVDPHLGISPGWRIMERKVNMNDGTIDLELSGSQINTPFLLDYSLLDGTDLLI